jgi:hypothetical protein
VFPSFFSRTRVAGELSRFWLLDMFSYLTTLLGTNVGLSFSESVLDAPFATFPGPVIHHVGVRDNVSYDGVPEGDLKGRRLAVQGHRGAQGMRTEASLYVSSAAPQADHDLLDGRFD